MTRETLAGRVAEIKKLVAESEQQNPIDQDELDNRRAILARQEKALEETLKIQKLSDENMKKINDAAEAEAGDSEKREMEQQVKEAKKFRDELVAEL